jgi:tetratricopeptide (TPR) repeat protein
LFLTHIDDAGQSSPPVELSQFTTAGRAANIPEFVNAEPDAIGAIREQFIDDYSYARAGSESLKYGEPDAAEQLLRKALAENPRNANAHNNLGTILAEKGNLNEAKVHYSHALTHDPGEHNARRNLAAILLEQGDVAEAIALYRVVVQAQPQSAVASSKLAIALLKAGEVAEASKYFANAARLDPQNAEAQFYLGMVSQRLGNERSAAEAYAASLRCQPDYVPAVMGLASIRIMARDPDLRDLNESLVLAEQASQLTGHRDPSVLDLLARVYDALGRGTEAMEITTKALQLAESTGKRHLVDHLRQRLRMYADRKTSSH